MSTTIPIIKDHISDRTLLRNIITYLISKYPEDEELIRLLELCQ